MSNTITARSIFSNSFSTVPPGAASGWCRIDVSALDSSQSTAGVMSNFNMSTAEKIGTGEYYIYTDAPLADTNVSWSAHLVPAIPGNNHFVSIEISAISASKFYVIISYVASFIAAPIKDDIDFSFQVWR